MHPCGQPGEAEGKQGNASVLLGPVMLLKLGDTGTMVPGRKSSPATKHFSRTVVGGVSPHKPREVLGYFRLVVPLVEIGLIHQVCWGEEVSSPGARHIEAMKLASDDPIFTSGR